MFTGIISHLGKVVSIERNGFSFSAGPSFLKKGDLVNLELALSANGRFEGHIVQGHVDGKAMAVNIDKEENSFIFKFRVDKSLTSYLVNKGSVCINGISLTVIEAKNDFFTVGIIPY